MEDLLYLPVEKVPVSEILNDEFEHPTGINHAIVVTKPGGIKRVVQYCSELYYLVPNKEILPAFEREISKFYQIEKNISISHDARFFVDFIMKDKSFMISKEDPIFPRVRLVNSYDGSIKYHFTAGFFRLICSNGLMIPTGYTKTIRSMHTPKLGKETSFEEVMQMTSEFLAEASDAVEVYKDLQDQVTKDWMMRIEEVTEETSFPVSLMEDVMARMSLELETTPSLEPSDWLVYNAFNYQLNHNTDFRAKYNKKDAIDQEVMDYLLKY